MYCVEQSQGNFKASRVITVANAGKNAALTVNGKWVGRSPLRFAQRRTTVMLMQGFISLMSSLVIKDACRMEKTIPYFNPLELIKAIPTTSLELY